ncbi:MAG: TrkH family potassium uptake protein [Hahellaceae bacterium]|jgi:trk system potassium uptake protein TrkH|nr:TrkH family potassium uptake protein [Hahellaceae bacterium]
MYLFVPLFNVLSIALALLALSMLTPLALILAGETIEYMVFIQSATATAVGSLFFRALGRGYRRRLIQRQLFLITAGSWLVAPFFAMLPFLLIEKPLSLADAFFETVSGITTTGATVITGLDQLTPDILLYRSILQWFGGVGIIGMAIAILPSLKTGGMKLFRTESSDWSEKATARTNNLLNGIMAAYITLTILCFICYRLAGMDLFNAINHALTTVATGGFSTSDQSFAQFESHALHWIAIFFMIAGSIPFFLYVQAWHVRSARVFSNVQVLGLLAITAGVTLILAIDLAATENKGLLEALTLSAFNVTSVISTTGYASADYMQWGNATVVTFFFLMFIGGCSGSTSGGVKVFRCQLFFVQLKKQLIKSIHPNAVIASKYGGRMVSEDIMQSCIAFIFLVMTSLIVVTFLLSLTGLDFMTSATGASSALMNVGPGLGHIIGPAGSFKPLSDVAKWLLSFSMILGRLEFIAIVILFTRTFWRG